MWHLVFFLIRLVFVTANEDDCNEIVCGSIVSKCLLTQSCQCKLNDCHCCKDCLNCLGKLYTECCGCLDMCPAHKDVPNSMNPRSEIGDVGGVPELFDTLTSEDDDQWSTIHIPVSAGFKHRLEGNSGIIKKPKYNPTGIVNCTVIYVNSCIQSLKCMQQCESMGANSYRWFHNGCCECVGAHCLNYGINESRCIGCSDDPEQVTDDTIHMNAQPDIDHILEFEEDARNDMWDYGENDDMT